MEGRREGLRRQRLNSEVLEAVKTGDKQEVLRLLAHGASVNATCAPAHCAAVHVASLFGHTSILRLLVERGAAVTCLDTCDRSPAHLAAWAGSRECLHFLLEKCPQLLHKRTRLEKLECEVIPRDCQDSTTHDHGDLISKLPTLTAGSTALHVASLSVHVGCIQCLLAAGADHSLEDDEGMSPLDVLGQSLVGQEQAIQLPRSEGLTRFPHAIEILISAGTKIKKSTFKRNSAWRKTLFQTAIELKSLESIRLLVKSFGTLFWERPGETPLHIAVDHRLEGPLKVILEACGNGGYAVVDVPNTEEVTALQAAVSAQWEVGVNILLEAGASILCKTSNNNTVLHLAADTGNANILQELLKVLSTEEDQILNATNNSGDTPLYCAVNSGNIKCVTLLLNANVDISKKTFSEFTILHRAAEYNHPEILELLLQKDRNAALELLEAKDTARVSGLTPLLVAARNGFEECVRVLLGHGCDVRARVKDSKVFHECTGETALHLASAGGHQGVVRLLLAHQSALVHETDSRGRTPLHEACRHGHGECARLLLASSADLSARCRDEDGGEVTAMELLMNNLARPVSFLERALDASMAINDKEMTDSDIAITLDYSILHPQQEHNQLRVIDALTQTGNGFGQQTLLLHPLIESFLYLKWKKMSPYFYALFALYTIFVVTFSILCIVRHYYSDTNTVVPPGLDESVCRYIVVVVVSVLAFIQLVNILQMPLLYLWDTESWIKIVSFILSLLVTFIDMDDHNEYWLRQVTAVAILLTWMQYLYLISRVPRIGYFILMFARVTINVVCVLITFVGLIIGFGISFMVQFKANPPFNTPSEALIKTFIMMTGDFDYTGLFEQEIATSSIVARMIFILFVILVGIALMNLLVGMAVNDITGLEVRGNISRLRKQAEFLSLIERLVFSHVLLCIIPRWLKEQRHIPSKIKLLPGKPKKSVARLLPSFLKEKIVVRVVQNKMKVVGEPTLQDVYEQLNSLSNSVDILSGNRINVSDHIDSNDRYDLTDSGVRDVVSQMNQATLALRRWVDQQNQPKEDTETRITNLTT